MTQLTNKQFSTVYGDLLTTTNNGQGLTNVLRPLQDGLGDSSPMSIATNAVNFDRTGGREFGLDAIALTASADDINSVCTPNSPTIPGTGAVLVPKGTTAERPAVPIDGMIRFNTDIGTFEFYQAGWVAPF